MLVRQIAIDIVKNIAMGIGPVRSLRMRKPRTCDSVTPMGVDQKFRSFIDPVENISQGLNNKTILEIGPGDNLVTGLAFLAKGARSFTALDRFPGNYNSKTARHWYDAVGDRLGVKLTDPVDPRINILPTPVEAAEDIGQFDIVCSHAVGEHVTSVAAFATMTRRCLTQGGVAVHVIDFSGHHWHRDDDPDLFRRFPGWLWNAMGSNRGLPNRVGPDEFMAHFRYAGLTCEFDIEGMHGILICRRPPAPDLVG